MRRAATRAGGRTSEATRTALTVRVNVSGRQLADNKIVDAVAEALEESGIDPAGLCLEVTESVLIEDPESSTATLAELKALGVQIAVDDFGTGYSSLEHLRRFPIDSVKIDRSFVRGLPHSSEDVAIVSAVIELGHALNLSVVAEGVETSDQLGNLQAAGCDSAQGFLFAGRSTRTSSTGSSWLPLWHRAPRRAARMAPARPLRRFASAARGPAQRAGAAAGGVTAAPVSGRRPQPEARAAPGPVVRGSAARPGRPPRARSCPSRTRR